MLWLPSYPGVQTALGDEAVFLAESIFRVFDDDCSGTMDFQEYVLALHSTRSVTLGKLCSGYKSEVTTLFLGFIFFNFFI